MKVKCVNYVTMVSGFIFENSLQYLGLPFDSFTTLTLWYQLSKIIIKYKIQITRLDFISSPPTIMHLIYY